MRTSGLRPWLISHLYIVFWVMHREYRAQGATDRGARFCASVLVGIVCGFNAIAILAWVYPSALAELAPVVCAGTMFSSGPIGVVLWRQRTVQETKCPLWVAMTIVFVSMALAVVSAVCRHRFFGGIL